MLPAAAHLKGGRELQLAVLEDGGRLCAAVPLRPVLNLAGFRILTCRPFQVVELTTPLLAPEAPAQTMAELLGLLADEGRGGVLALGCLGADGAVAAQMRQAARTMRMPWRDYGTWTRPVFRRDDTPSELVRPRRARALRRWRRGLVREFGEEPRAVERSGSAEWADRFLALEADGWKGALCPGTGDLAHRPGHPAWFRESVLAMTECGAARLFSLEAGNKLLAMFYVLANPDRGLFAHRMCYDEEFRAYAPGVQLLLETIHFFLEETKADFFDSCTFPCNSHFSEFFRGSRRIADVVIGIGNAADRLAAVTTPVAVPVLRQVRRCAGRVRAAALARPVASGT